MANRIATIPGTFGAAMPKENLESDRTKGFEVELRHRNRVGQVNYSVSGNIAITRSMWRYKERTPSVRPQPGAYSSGGGAEPDRAPDPAGEPPGQSAPGGLTRSAHTAHQYQRQCGHPDGEGSDAQAGSARAAVYRD